MTAGRVPLLTVIAPAARAGAICLPDENEAELCRLYQHPAPPTGAYLRAGMVSSLDGAAAGRDGTSRSINNEADLRVFRVLRATADAILVGARTARAEVYGQIRIAPGLRAARAAHGRTEAPVLVVVTRSGTLPDALLDSEQEPIALVPRGSAAEASLTARWGGGRVIAVGAGDVDLTTGLAELAARGLPRVLCEGGPELLGHLFTAGLVDEWCLTFSPIVVGGDASRTVATPSSLEPAAPARLAHLLHSDGVLLGRWLLRD